MPWVVLDGVRVNDAFTRWRRTSAHGWMLPKPGECGGEK